ncbi:hypothetical protein CSUI_000554 [Cystoisospora suis]|uniref:Uncharacterized protein n=1 Tax=Cystoisospora suis TaxID=483139 RepID=A0A2C6LDH1_9APIC|nr:hypothetical protein CSUI_000554 [Cystoisospora suis]
MVFPGPVGGMSKEGEGEKKAQGVSPPAPSSQATTQEILPVGHGGPAQGGGAPQTGSQQMSGASGGGGSVAHRSSSRTAPQPSSSSQPTTSFSNPGASKFGASGGEKVAGGGDGATEGDRSGRTQAAGGSQGREGQSIDSAAYPSTQVQLAVDHDNRKRSIANPSNQMDNSYQHQAPALSSSTSQHLEGRQQTNLTAFSGMLSGHSQRPDTQEPPQASPSMTQGPAAQRNLSILQQEPQSTLSSQLHQGNSTQQQQQQASHHQVVQTVGKGVDGGRGLPSGEGGKEQEQYYQTSKRLCQDRALSSSVEMKERQAQVYHQSQSSHNSSSHTGVHTHQPPSHTSSKAIDQQTAPHHVESSITAPTSEQQLTRQPENSTGGVVAREGGSTQPGVALLRHSGSQGPGALPSSPASNEVVYQAQFRQTVTSLEPKQDEIPYSSSSASNMGQNQKSPSLAATPYHQRAVGTAVGGAPGAPAGQCQQGLLPLSMSRPSFQSQSHRGSFSGSTPAVGSSRDFQDLQGRQQSETSQEAVALGQNSVDHRFSPSPQQHSYYNPSYYSPAQGENRNSREQLTLQQQQQQKTGAVVMQGHAHSSRETQSCQGPSSAQTPSHSLPVQNQSRPSEDAHPLRFQEGTRQHQQVFDMAGQTQAELFRRQHREMQRLPGEAQLGEPLHQASLPHQRGEVAGEGSKMTRQSHITQQPETESHLVNQTSFRQGVHSLQQQPQAGQYASVQQRAMSHQEQHQSSRVSPGQQTTQEDRQVRAYNAGQSASPGVQIQQGGSVPQGLRHSERSHDSQAQLTSAQGGVSKHQIPQIQSTMAGGQGAVPYSPAPPQGSPHLTASNSMAGSQPDPDFGLQQQNRVFVQAGGRIQPPHKLLSPYSQTPER